MFEVQLLFPTPHYVPGYYGSVKDPKAQRKEDSQATMRINLFEPSGKAMFSDPWHICHVLRGEFKIGIPKNVRNAWE